ncbi:hypothetical protein BD413DRAFT_551605 [Trametes elegans]|nr:hypothetical protein BD413DRAFT_551605 [Trametes elegans]
MQFAANVGSIPPVKYAVVNRSTKSGNQSPRHHRRSTASLVHPRTRILKRVGFSHSPYHQSAFRICVYEIPAMESKPYEPSPISRVPRLQNSFPSTRTQLIQHLAVHPLHRERSLVQ